MRTWIPWDAARSFLANIRRELCAVALQIRQNSRGRRLLNYSARATLDCPSRTGEGQCVRQCARKFFRSLSDCLPIQVAGVEDRARKPHSGRSRWWLPSHLPTIPVSPIRHNRISIGADLFIHDAGHARQIFSLTKFFSLGIQRPANDDNALPSGLRTGTTF